MNIQSDIKVLDDLLALNLDISLWSARKKMTAEDLGSTELPPEDLASLGSKRIADPANLKIFGTLKARATSYLDKHGVRFMSGWAIPQDMASEVTEQLAQIRDEFMLEKEKFLASYNESVSAWIEKHGEWADIIKNSIVNPDYVRSRMSFGWQLYKVMPSGSNAVIDDGLCSEVESLGSTLFSEVADSARDMWKKVFEGKTEVTHKALSPLKTLHNKLTELSFIEPHVMPVADIISASLQRIPKKGNIVGADLLLLQGLVCLLKDSKALLEHAHKIIQGYGPATVVDYLASTDLAVAKQELSEEEPMPILPALDENLADDFPLVDVVKVEIPSMGLW